MVIIQRNDICIPSFALKFWCGLGWLRIQTVFIKAFVGSIGGSSPTLAYGGGFILPVPLVTYTGGVGSVLKGTPLIISILHRKRW